MRLRRALVTGVVATTAAATGLTITADAAQAPKPVRLSSAHYDSPGRDTGSNRSLNAEWIRVKNYTHRARTLTGWTVRDTAGNVFRFPRGFKLRHVSSVIIHTGSGRDTAGHQYWGKNFYVWNNSGDKATLKNRAGKRVDACSWGDGDGTKAC